MARYDISRAWFQTPGGRAVLMHIREGTNDWNTCTAAMTHDEYGLRGLGLTGAAVDIGGHLGAVSIAMLIDNPGLLVHTVEPIPENCDLIRKNAAINAVDDRLVLHEAAAGDPTAGTTVIRYAYEDDENSLHHAYIGNAVGGSDDPDRPHREAVVPTLALDDLPAAGFMKVDCEGGEWGLFARGADPARHPLIVGEWHPVGGHQRDHLAAMLDGYALTFTGPEGGPGGFRASATPYAGAS